MKVVGLTGGIGSGKSSVLEVFSAKGIPCYKADDRAKKLMQEDEELIFKIKKWFGDNIYDAHRLNRKRLAKLVFDDKNKLKKLNAIVHPAVQKDFQLFLSKQNAPYVIKEAAILFESGGADQCDTIILVTAPEEIRINRVMKRENTDADAVKSRMKHQWSDEKKIPLADFVIDNIDWDQTLKKIEEVHKSLLHSESTT
ncbi:MAG: dephospho-CoA kinase [Bacteroidetes bacterium]|nr:dephospho-CoA kinase [Bacteroidota bacterium]